MSTEMDNETKQVLDKLSGKRFAKIKIPPILYLTKHQCTAIVYMPGDIIYQTFTPSKENQILEIATDLDYGKYQIKVEIIDQQRLVMNSFTCIMEV